MTYFPMGDVSFNSTKYPGICKPSNQETLDLVYELQRQLNRIAHMSALPKIAVDGDLGPATVKLFNSVTKLSATCEQISSSLATRVSGAKRVADAMNAPTSVSGPKPASPPVIVLPTGQELVAKPPAESAGFSLDALKNMSTTTMVGLAVVTVGLGYFLLSKRKARP